MKLHTMIEVYLKYDNMHINGTINAFICINNHVNSCTNCMLSEYHEGEHQLIDAISFTCIR